MLDPCTEPTLIETVPQLALVVATQFTSEKGGNICGFDRMGEGFQESRVEGLQRLSVLDSNSKSEGN